MNSGSQIYDCIVKKTNMGKEVPIVNKNGVNVHKLTIFEEIVLRNLDNLNGMAIEIAGSDTKMTYLELFKEVEKYMSAYKNMGLKEHDVVSLCLPVSVEFICSYLALTTLGVSVNALNIMFILNYGLKDYLDKRCSNTFVCDGDFFHLIASRGKLNDDNLKKLIITGDATYTHHKDSDIFVLPAGLKKVDVLSFTDFLKTANMKDTLSAVDYNEDRISTLNYTSGTTGKPKCMGHSDLAPLFLIAAHDSIKRDEHRGDRTLLTIPLQHPTGLFYSAIFQLAQGKTLVLEPRYDKRLFAEDIKKYEINHAVQAKPFYAQLIQDRADGKLKPGDFEHFRNPYSGGEGIPYASWKQIDETLKYAGCPNDLILGYGRSEEGSSTIVPYNIDGRQNTVGVPLPGIKLKIVEAGTLKELKQEAGVKGEILVSCPVHPIDHCYLDDYNKDGKSDNSFVDEEGIRWARPEDIGTYVKMPDGSLSLLALGRAHDYAIKNDKKYYLFDLKEYVNSVPGVQECEVVKIKNGDQDYINAHILLTEDGKKNKEKVIKEIAKLTNEIDGIKIHDIFGINATSGKCDREAMSNDYQDYYQYNDGKIEMINYENKDSHVLKRVKKIG